MWKSLLLAWFGFAALCGLAPGQLAQGANPATETSAAAPLVVEELQVGKDGGLGTLPHMLYKGGELVYCVSTLAKTKALFKSDGGPFEPVRLDDGRPVTGSSIEPAGHGANLSFTVYGLNKLEFGFVALREGKAQYYRVVKKDRLELREFHCHGADRNGSILVTAKYDDGYSADQFYVFCTSGNELRHVQTPEQKPLMRFDRGVHLRPNGRFMVARPTKEPGEYQHYWIENGSMVAVEEIPSPDGAKRKVRMENVFHYPNETFVFAFDAALDSYVGWIAKEGKADWLVAPDDAVQRFRQPVPFLYGGRHYISESFNLRNSKESEGNLYKVEGHIVSPVAWNSKDKKGSIAATVFSKGCLISSGTKGTFENWTLHWLTESGVNPIEMEPGKTLTVESACAVTELGDCLLFQYWSMREWCYLLFNGRNYRSADLGALESWPLFGEHIAAVGGVLLRSKTFYDGQKTYGVQNPGYISAMDRECSDLSLTFNGARIEGRRVMMVSCRTCVFVLLEGKSAASGKLLRIKARP